MKKIYLTILAFVAILLAGWATTAVFFQQDERVDLTSKITNPNLDDGLNGWTVLEASGQSLGVKAASSGNPVYTCFKGVFDIRQTIKDLQPGVYTLKVQAFSRPTANADAVSIPVEEQENNVDALTGLAETYGRKMDYDRELEARRQIAGIQPDNMDNRVRIIEIMIRNKEYEAAKKETEEVLSQYESEELSALYEMMLVDAPEFTLTSGEYDEYQLLDIVSHGDNAIVRYTLDGTDPDIASPIWSDQLVISYPETEIRAIAYSPLGFPSEVTDLNLKITKPAEAVVSGRSYDNGSYMLRYLVDKSYDQTQHLNTMDDIPDICLLQSVFPIEYPLPCMPVPLQL